MGTIKCVALRIGTLLFWIGSASKLKIMLGRGHLSMLRQSHGSWPDRENFVSAPVAGREDMVLMDGQLERDSVLEFCPKSRPQKYFSPPKRPWDFSKVSQPKRLWDFSPPFCKERLVNARSTRRNQDLREQCCGSVDRVCTMGGISNQLSSAHRSTVCLAEYGDTVSRSHQANVRQGFRSKKMEVSFMEPAQSQDHDLQSIFDHQTSSFTKADTVQKCKASQLSAKVEFEIEEIERLKARMALLCEKLAWQISRRNKGPSETGINSFDSEENLLLKGIGELKSVISPPTGRSELRREPGNAFDPEHAGGQEIGEMCRCRNLACKSGIGTLLQAILWCIGFMITLVRCTHGCPELIPT